MPLLYPSRRDALRAGGALFAWGGLPALARAEGRDPRLLVVILRGALDGLAAVAPVGDPGWVKLRGDKALTLEGKTPALRLDDFFALNPAMPNLHRLFVAGQATLVHAASTPYRERSHFDGQDVLESGAEKPGFNESGWLNRALGHLKAEGRAKADERAFVVGPMTPLVARGPAPILTWQSPLPQPADADTAQRLLDLYGKTDPALAVALEGRLRLIAMGKEGGVDAAGPGRTPSPSRRASPVACRSVRSSRSERHPSFSRRASTAAPSGATRSPPRPAMPCLARSSGPG